MSRDWRVYLGDIGEHGSRIVEFTRGMTFEEFVADLRTHDAVVRNLEVVGEAVKHLPPEVRARRPDVPWRRIAGFRDRLAHAYFAVDDRVVWDVVVHHLPLLLKATDDLLKEEPGTGA